MPWRRSPCWLFSPHSSSARRRHARRRARPCLLVKKVAGCPVKHLCAPGLGTAGASRKRTAPLPAHLPHHGSRGTRRNRRALLTLRTPRTSNAPSSTNACVYLWRTRLRGTQPVHEMHRRSSPASRRLASAAPRLRPPAVPPPGRRVSGWAAPTAAPPLLAAARTAAAAEAEVKSRRQAPQTRAPPTLEAAIPAPHPQAALKALPAAPAPPPAPAPAARAPPGTVVGAAPAAARLAAAAAAPHQLPLAVEATQAAAPPEAAAQMQAAAAGTLRLMRRHLNPWPRPTLFSSRALPTQLPECHHLGRSRAPSQLPGRLGLPRPLRRLPSPRPGPLPAQGRRLLALRLPRWI